MLAALAAAPLFVGWVNQCRAWLQNQSRAEHLAAVSRHSQAVPQGCGDRRERLAAVSRSRPTSCSARWCCAAGDHSLDGHRLPFSRAADAIALVGLLATARVFLSLAAMDIGTAFGTLGARREMMVGFLAEPALLMVIFVASLISATTALPAISERLATQSLALYPSLAFTAVAFTLVLLAENARIPIDNPATHLELTMIHEAMLLEYSARHLALMEWAAALKLFNYACIGFALFVPWGIATQRERPGRARCWLDSAARAEARGRRRRARVDRDGVGEAARVSRAGVSRHRVSVRGAGPARAPAAGSLSHECARHSTCSS